MIEIEARLSELEALGLSQRPGLVSGPQGPHVVLNGRPVLMLSSDNYLGLADHPRVRQAAADAAMRWGVGAGAPRLSSGTMTIHRRLEERLAEFMGRQSALLFGAAFLANAGVIPALARPGDVVFSDEFNHPSITEGCQRSGAEVFVYDHLDMEHLAWGIGQAQGHGALIVTESVFSLDGDIAPLEDLAELRAHHGIRLMVDESHAIGTLGRGGRGALALAELEGHVDVIAGTLGAALGAYGAFVAADAAMTQYLMSTARSLLFSTAPSPPAVAGALAALELLDERPGVVERLQANAEAFRRELHGQGIDTGHSGTQIIPITLGELHAAVRAADHAWGQGVFARVLRPPAVPAMASGLRATVMASHRIDELRWGARTLAEALRKAMAEPELSLAEEEFEFVSAAEGAFFDGDSFERASTAGVFDLEADQPPPARRVFDLESDGRLAA